MESSPRGWPPEVASYYADLAERRGWPSSVIQAFSESVDYYRGLDESRRERTFWEERDDAGRRWLFEAVRSADEHLVAIRQIEVEADGARRCYSWRRLEDDDGFLTTDSLDHSIDRFNAISADRFLAEWRDCTASFGG